MRQLSIRLFSVVLLSIGPGTAVVSALGTNIIRNPNAEASAAPSACTPVSAIPYWTVTHGQFSLCPYAATPGNPDRIAITDPGPADRGSTYFNGGPASEYSAARQVIDISDAISLIDTGNLTFVLSGWLGGWRDHGDEAVVAVDFLSADSSILGSAQIGPGHPYERGYASGLVQRSWFGLVPAGARRIEVRIELNRVDGDWNDASADSLSLVLSPVSGASAMRFIPVSPCRISDTRLAIGPFGGPSIQAGATRGIPIPQSPCGIPSNAGAYSLNVTVVPRGSLGYLTIYPTGQWQPLVSTLNSADGRIKANAAIVPAGVNGSVSVYVTNTTDVILDINGYFIGGVPTIAYQFYPMVPCRVADTRWASGSLGGPVMSPGSVRSFPVLQSSCGIPASAKAYAMNVTVVPQTGSLGYLTTWPTGSAQPFVSTLNSPTGTVVANAAIVPSGNNGAISVYVTDRTDVIVDISGYFAAPAADGYSFYTTSPCRISDTRNPVGPFGGPTLVESSAIEVAVHSSTCGLPPTARAYSLNATVVPKGYLGYLTLFPCCGSGPVVSTLNSFDGSIVANAAIVPAGDADGTIVAFVTNVSDLILDINGYFAP
jgi:hypothetical protein